MIRKQAERVLEWLLKTDTEIAEWKIIKDARFKNSFIENMAMALLISSEYSMIRDMLTGDNEH